MSQLETSTSLPSALASSQPIFRPSPDTFVVEEIPAYEPCGTGEHTYVWLEKKDFTTNEAVKRLGHTLGIKPRDIGFAGQKDRHATTRQWLSLPGNCRDALAQLQIEGLSILTIRQHGNKLRLGHNRGNRFEVTIQNVSQAQMPKLREAFAELTERGLPNRFGAQRFGRRGDNPEIALQILLKQRKARDARKRRFLYSALQSAIFNDVLEKRIQDKTARTALVGDVLQKTASGGIFVCQDTQVDQARIDAGELVVTGPLPGNREVAPPSDSPAGQLEAEIAAAHGLHPSVLESAGRDLPGARRPLFVSLGQTTFVPEQPATSGGDAKANAAFDVGASGNSASDPNPSQPDAPDAALDEAGGPGANPQKGPYEAHHEGRVKLCFSLPSGAYATAVLQALGVTIESGAKPASV